MFIADHNCSEYFFREGKILSHFYGNEKEFFELKGVLKDTTEICSCCENNANTLYIIGASICSSVCWCHRCYSNMNKLLEENALKPIDRIEKFKQEIDKITPSIKSLVDESKSLHKLFSCFKEELVEKMLELDLIESEGKDNIRTLRKEQIDRIQGLLSELDQCRL